MSHPIVPSERAVYRGGPGIRPAWLLGRRLLVTRVLTRAGLDKLNAESGGSRHRVADTDAEIKAGRPMPDLRLDPSEIVLIEVSVMARGRVTFEQVNPSEWDAVPA